MMTDITTFLMIPGMVMVFGALAVPFIPHHARQVFMLGLIACSAVGLTAGAGVHWQYELFGQTLVLHRVDNLTLPFAVVFHIAAAITVIYGWMDKTIMGPANGLAYGGAAIAAIHAGDLISLFIWWELTAVTSVFLIFAAGTARGNAAAVRYLLVQVASGVLLLAGAAFIWRESGSLAFDAMTLGSMGTWLLFLAFGIKAAFPLLNGWLQDAYPEATITGTVVLSAFTTKMAIYALARGFAGTEHLIWIGSVMAILPAVFALAEQDMRRVLAYSLNNQLGFMVVAIGIGTELALNGAVAHAFVSVLYKALLFMAMGGVLYRLGTTDASRLGSLYKAMPLTLAFTLIGAMSIAAMPLMSGFVAKSYIMKAAASPGLNMVYLMLLLGSVATIMHTAIRLPYTVFFGSDQGYQSQDPPKDPPFSMLAGMGIAAAACIVIGVYPPLLIDILPYAASAKIYYASGILSQVQLIVFTALGVGLMIKLNMYPKNIPSVLLNADWLYRRLGPALIGPIINQGLKLGQGGFTLLTRMGQGIARTATKMADHPLSGPVIPGPAAFVQVTLLAMILGVIYVALA